MGRLIILALITLLAAFEAQSQTAPQAAPAKPAPNVTEMAISWVDRMNGLSNWRLSMTGTEEQADQVVNQMMELFAPDVIAQVPPHDEEQIGPVMLMGAGQLRKYFDKIARSQIDIKYKIQQQTQRETDGEVMVYSKPLPWGGIGVSFQVHAAYSMREDRQRFLELGAVFLQFRDDGKIERLRLILSEKDTVDDRVGDEI
jgi:hypothetical protein